MEPTGAARALLRVPPNDGRCASDRVTPTPAEARGGVRQVALRRDVDRSISERRPGPAGGTTTGVPRAWPYEALLRQAVGDPSRRLGPVLLEDVEPPVPGQPGLGRLPRCNTAALYDAALAELVRSLPDLPVSDLPNAREWPAAVARTVRPAGTMALTLRVTRNQVTLVGGGANVSQRPHGLRATLGAAGDLARPGHTDADGLVAYRGSTVPRWPTWGDV